jgi:hypothetical protein
MPNTPPPTPSLQLVMDGLRAPTKALRDSVERAITTLTPLPQAPPAGDIPPVDPGMVEFLTEICEHLGALAERLSALERSTPRRQSGAETLRGVAAAIDAWRAGGESDEASSVEQTLRVIEMILKRP